MKRFRHNYTNLAIIILNTILIFAIFEISARVALFHLVPESKFLRFKLPDEWPRKSLKLTPHPYLSYSTTPGYINFNNGRKEFVHNSLGFRGDEITKIKKNGVFRIVALGGSTTYTSGTALNSNTYPSLLEKILIDKYHYSNIEVINAGVPGYTSWESLVNFQFRVLDLNPDLIIVYHGTNDTHARLVHPMVYQSDNTGSRKHWENPAIPFWEYSVLARFFARLRIDKPPSENDFTGAITAHNPGPNPMETLRQNPPTYFKRNLSNIIAIAKHKNIKIMFATWASSPNLGYAKLKHYKKGFSEAVEIVQQLGSKNAIPVFEFHKLMPTDSKYWTDGIHVNSKGSLIKAELFAKFIVQKRLIPDALRE